MNIGFLVSHRGSNMQAVVDACTAGRLDARVCVVISNNSYSEALVRAHNQGIPCFHLSSRTHPKPEQLDLTIAAVLRQHKADLVILAGYMKKIGARTLSEFSGRMINIHPCFPSMAARGCMVGLFMRLFSLRAKRRLALQFTSLTVSMTMGRLS
jgi:phosphoribosylglycinamide formyltransferase-1